MSRRGSSPAGAGRHVVIVTPTRGDAGNLAVLDALLVLTGGEVDVVLGADRRVAPSLDALPAHVVALPALLAGAGPERRAAVLRVERLLLEADHCTVIAPDAVRTRDDLHVFLLCLAMARRAAQRGVDARVLGFAWSVDGGASIGALRAAVRAGVDLYVRDDISFVRTRVEDVPGARRSADLAFADPTECRAILPELGLQGRPAAVLPVSATVVGGADPAADYVAIVEHLQQRGVCAVLQPSTFSGYDLLMLGRVARSVGGAEPVVVRRPLRAGEQRALCGSALLTVVDQPRLAVLAVSAGAAVVGLAADLELEHLLRGVGPGAASLRRRRGFSQLVLPMVDAALAQPMAAREPSRRALPELAELARSSLVGLPERRDGSAARSA